jgi:hypothetical protein
MLALVCAAGDAEALRMQPRPNYMVGVGWGMGRGVFHAPDGSMEEYREGGIGLIRVGRMLGQHAMVGASYAGWIIEFDKPSEETGRSVAALGDEEEPLEIDKNRFSQQVLVLSLTLFPGNPRGLTGGVYMRAGGGMGWAGIGEVPVLEGVPKGHGERIDQWGWSFFAEGGYDFWISDHASLGVGLLYSYLGLNRQIVDRGWLAGASVNFNIHF